MNIVLLALVGLFLSQTMRKSPPEEKKSKFSFDEIAKMGILNDSAVNLIDSVSKFKDGKDSGALLELLANPVVFELAKNFLFKQPPKTDVEEEPVEDAKPQEETTEESASDTSQESKDFFKPVEKVAGVEISKELYNLYDNWYVK